ncbi:undecaprenyl-diphosphatase [Bacillus pakistanensis]|uniref:Undecaprenyl-diphosphatase n=1 Tax=Rossellomorea pakistanensis TaxID=992288 RepID=A0ABS2NJL3_9BACI|nr:YqaA family protein [Bacillus pakistanensis]MBM7588051.1 undecaprenyl-diphosphatase [Bacillus pakistanensis]
MSEMIHSLEVWLLEYGVWGLILVSFADSSFFPIPPDVLLIPLSLANPSSALLYAFYTTLASVLGAIFGWFIGRKIGRPVLIKIFSEEKILKVEEAFNKYGPMAILIAGFTPIPYKVFTIFAGVSNIPLRILVIWSIIGRGLRFFLEAILIMTLGAKAKPFIEENFTMVTIVAGVVLIALFLIYKLLQKRKQVV